MGDLEVSVTYKELYEKKDDQVKLLNNQLDELKKELVSNDLICFFFPLCFCVIS